MMIAQSQVRSKPRPVTAARFTRLAAGAALLVLLTALVEILIEFVPGGYQTAHTPGEWFALLQHSPLLGLRNLGLLNIVMAALNLPVALALYRANRKTQPAFAALALALGLVGAAVFFATNPAFAMLALSAQVPAGAAAPAQEAAGLALLAAGQGHTAGSFLAFFFSALGGGLAAWVTLKAGQLSAWAGRAGIVSYACLLAYEILVDFAPAAPAAVFPLALVGGLANMVWYGLVARGLLRLEASEQ